MTRMTQITLKRFASRDFEQKKDMKVRMSREVVSLTDSPSFSFSR